MLEDVPAIDRSAPEEIETATLALGCFWGPDSKFGVVPGVVRTKVGYAGGEKEEPTYYHLGDHTETIQLVYDPGEISYQELLKIFWNIHDPTAQRSTQYKSIIFYHNKDQRRLATESRREIERRLGEGVKTEILPFTDFHLAEDYHQKYYLQKRTDLFEAFKSMYPNFEDFINSTAVARANGYVAGYGQISGSDDLEKLGLSAKGRRTLFDIWDEEKDRVESPKCLLECGRVGSQNFAKPSDEELEEGLTPLQYRVTQKNGTEEAFNNEYWDNKKEGIYVDVVSGEPLFSSRDKFQSGSGWPSFTKPLEPENIVEKEDRSRGMNRTEVRSKHADSHLGHVFDDGPEPTGKRYCMNSAALRFIPAEDLEEEGYGEYNYLFED